MKARKPGSFATIGVFSSSSPVSATVPIRYERGVEYLSNHGYRVRNGILRGKKDHYRSGSIKERAEEFNRLIYDDEVDIVMAAIGGNNTNSILPYVDYGYLREHPKVIIGYSDTTALLPAIYAKTGLMSTVCFAVNTRLEKELWMDIRSYEDLLDPRLKGKIIFSDPNSSSAAWNNLCNIFSVYGVDTPEAWAIIEGLMRNGMAVGSSSSKCFKDVANGEYVVGLTYDNGAVTMLGAPDYEMRYPSNGTSGKDSCFAIIKNCKHPEAAKAFVEAMTSKEGTEKMYSVYGGVRFTNTEVVEPSTFELGKTKDIKWVDRPVDELTAKKDDLLRKWNDLYSKVY